MSEKTQTNTPIIVVADPDEESVEVVVKKKSFWQKRVVAPVKKHPRIASAIAGGAALVCGAAYLGRKTAPTVDVLIDPSELESGEVVEVEILESNPDTETA